MQTAVSIIIPVKDGVKGGIENCFSAVFSQETSCKYEVIVIDSGSADGTLDIVKRYPAIRLIQIKSEEFGHGRTRNLGAWEAKGEYIVFLNADAWPANDKWLDALIRDLGEDEKVAGVYSRHLPKKGSYLCVERSIIAGMPDKGIIKGKKGDNLTAKDIFYSTVSAAIRKSVFDDIPFRENIFFAEDQYWSKDVLEAGYKIAYEPMSMVYHSHDYNFPETYIFAKKSRIVWQRLLSPKKIFHAIFYYGAYCFYFFAILFILLNEGRL